MTCKEAFQKWWRENYGEPTAHPIRVVREAFNGGFIAGLEEAARYLKEDINDEHAT
jgi:hypothetical protein